MSFTMRAGNRATIECHNCGEIVTESNATAEWYARHSRFLRILFFRFQRKCLR